MIIWSDTKENCQKILQLYKNICSFVGLPVCEEKTLKEPVQVIVYLGLLIDVPRKLIKAPMDKVYRALDMINTLLASKQVKVALLASFTGLMNFLTRPMEFIPVYLRRFYDLIGGKQQSDIISLSAECKLDVVVLQKFLLYYNGCSLMVHSMAEQPQLLQSDASFWGMSYVYQKYYMAAAWPKQLMNTSPSICLLEAIPLGCAFVTLGFIMSDSYILVKTDNEALVSILNKKSSKCPRIQQVIRLITTQCLKYNIKFKVEHIRSRQNIDCDLLSRSQQEQFLARHRGEHLVPLQPPESLWPWSSTKLRHSLGWL